MAFWDTFKKAAEYSIPGYGQYAAGRDIYKAGKKYVEGTPTGDPAYLREQVRRGIEGAQGRQAPQMTGAQIGGVRSMDTTQADQFRAQQMGLAGQLNRVASGQEQGAGELAVQRQAQRALSNVAGSATMARGGSAINAARASARGAGAIGLGAAGQAQQAAMGDQQSARAQLAGVLGQGREQDIGVAGANMSAENQRIFQQAGLDQATSLANMQARLQAIGMDDAAIQAYLSQLGALSAQDAAARTGREQLVGGLLSQAGQLGAAAAKGSDIRIKTNVTDASLGIDAMLDSLKPISWEYNDIESFGAGRHTGIVAQDLASTTLGADAIMTDPGGLMFVDTLRAVHTLLASVARLNHRVRELEALAAPVTVVQE